MPEDLRRDFQELAALDNASGPERRARGRQFERLLHNLLQRDGLLPRTSFRPRGEEIDGSFVLDGRVYLLEAKWHAEPLPASSVYAFRGKVDGKLSGTLGVFVSMSGFSPDAVDAITLGKHLNVLLVDRDDVAAAISPTNSFTDIMRQKLRIATEEGNIYFRRDAAAALADISSAVIAIVSEGRSDAMVLNALAHRIAGNVNVVSVPAGGKLAAASLANALLAASPTARCIIVVDSDGDLEGTRAAVQDRLADVSRCRIVAPTPTLDHWLKPNGIEHLNRASPFALQQAVRDADLGWLRSSAESFPDFEGAVRWATGT